MTMKLKRVAETTKTHAQKLRKMAKEFDEFYNELKMKIVPQIVDTNEEQEQIKCLRVKLCGQSDSYFGRLRSVVSAQRYLNTIHSDITLQWVNTHLDLIIIPSNDLDADEEVKKNLKQNGSVIGFRSFLSWLKHSEGFPPVWNEDDLF